MRGNSVCRFLFYILDKGNKKLFPVFLLGVKLFLESFCILLSFLQLKASQVPYEYTNTIKKNKGISQLGNSAVGFDKFYL